MGFLDSIKQALFPPAVPRPPMQRVEVVYDKLPSGRFRNGSGGLKGLAEIEVVGESFHQPELEQLAVSISGQPRNDRSAHVRVTAELIPNALNPKDRQAVEVWVEGQQIGHLTRERAPRYHAWMTAQGYERGALTGIEAEIMGGWKRPGDEGSYGVLLFLPGDIAEQLEP